MISLQTLPALVLCVVVIIRLVGLRFGWKPGILPAAALVTVAVVLNIDPVYLLLDGVLGSQNVLNLIVHLFMGAGMTELSRLILRATGRPDRHLKVLIGMGAVLALVQMVLLAVSDTQGSATNFTDVFGNIPTIIFYQASFWAWVGCVFGYTGIECLRRDRAGESRSFAIGFDFVSAGCLVGLVAVIAKMALLWMASAPEELAIADGLYVGYRVLTASSILLFAVGFIFPSYGRIKTSVQAREMRTQALDRLRPIVARLMATSTEDSSMDREGINLGARSSSAQLYRWLILIGDVKVLDPTQLTDQESALVDEIGRKFELNTSATDRSLSSI